MRDRRIPEDQRVYRNRRADIVAAFKVLWECQDPKCSLCGPCIQALRDVLERGRVPQVKPAQIPWDDPIRTHRKRDWKKGMR